MRELTVGYLALVAFFLTLTGCGEEDDPVAIPDEQQDSTEEVGYDLTHLPLGDPFILRRDRGQNVPAQLYLWLCGVPADGRGNADASDWTNPDGTWDYTRKPVVGGDVWWESEFAIELDGNGNRVISGNGLPDHPTGVFPIDPASVAYQYDRNRNAIHSHDVDYTFPMMPQEANSPNCLPFGASGISLSGAVIYHGSSTLANDAAAHEILDRFGGHSDGTNTYHYHFLTEDLKDHLDPPGPGHSALMGYMRDGFGIYGPRGEDGEILSSSDLDECHGHKHPVLWDGEMVDIYHYHWTYDFPYNVGCYKGTPR